jgi:hypothetical protein
MAQEYICFIIRLYKLILKIGQNCQKLEQTLGQNVLKMQTVIEYPKQILL